MAVLCPQLDALEYHAHSESEDVSLGHGESAEIIEMQLAQVRQHIQDRADQPALQVETDDSDINYHVPFKVIGKIKVRYRMIGPLKPRRMVFDDEEL